jgi:archaeosine synthase beta-subunit
MAAGCPHCAVGSVVAMHERVASPAEFVRAELARWDQTTFREICVYTPGSILDSEEVDVTELAAIIEIIRKNASPEKLVIETRPELVVQETLADLRRRGGKMSIEVSIPLESADSRVRKMIGKHFENDKFVAAVNAVKKSGCAFSTTVLIKPPGLSEGESIRDAWESLMWLFPMNPCRVVLEPMFVYDDTPLATLYLDGRYKPPWLWSLLALLEAAGEMAVEPGGEFVYPVPIARPKNCDKCSTIVDEYCRRNIHRVKYSDRPKCACENEWRSEVASHLSLLSRATPAFAIRKRTR